MSEVVMSCYRNMLCVCAIALLAACDGDPMSDAGAGLCTMDLACDDGLFCNGVERCAPDASAADARGCVSAEALACAAPMGCSEADDACIDDCSDDDGDGHDALSCGGDDCDDADPGRYPSNIEVCDAQAHDEDCDEGTFGARDVDSDGRTDARCCNALAAGGEACGDDCDDTRTSIRPGQVEVCNLRDDDCDGAIDEGVSVTLTPDLDRDGDGDRDAETMNVCAGTAGYALSATDCDDGPGGISRSRSGRTTDVTDGIDNDCDGVIDEASPPAVLFEDRDGDGYGTRRRTISSTTLTLGYALLEGDCDDLDPDVSPGAPSELCNGRDDDCDSFLYTIGYNDSEDDDGDRAADARCPGGGVDCDDGEPRVGPLAPEQCNLADDDCDGATDEGCVAPFDGGVPFVDAGPLPVDAGAPRIDAGPPPMDAGALPADAGRDAFVEGPPDTGSACTPTAVFRDADGDGFGVGDDFIFTCGAVPIGYSGQPGDCDDGDILSFPFADDAPGQIGIDDDCNGTPDG